MGLRERNFKCAREETGTACFRCGCGIWGWGVRFAGGTEDQGTNSPFTPGPKVVLATLSPLPGAVFCQIQGAAKPAVPVGHPLVPLPSFPFPAVSPARPSPRKLQSGRTGRPNPWLNLPPPASWWPIPAPHLCLRGPGFPPWSLVP